MDSLGRSPEAGQGRAAAKKAADTAVMRARRLAGNFSKVTGVMGVRMYEAWGCRRCLRRLVFFFSWCWVRL